MVYIEVRVRMFQIPQDPLTNIKFIGFLENMLLKQLFNFFFLSIFIKNIRTARFFSRSNIYIYIDNALCLITNNTYCCRTYYYNNSSNS